MSSLETAQSEQQESLIQMLQRMLHSRHDDYTEDTILGSDINRIRHLFYYLRSENIRIQINYQSEIYSGTISHVLSNKVIIKVPGFEESGFRRCRIKFEVISELYQFEVPVLEIGQGVITIKMPAFIQSLQRRKNKRIMVDDLFIRFGVLYRPIFGRRGAGQIVESRFPSIVSELEKDDPDLYLINHIITEELLHVSPYYEIKFYKKGEELTFLESMISEEKKTLFIRDTTHLENYYERQTLYGLINYHSEYIHRLRHSSQEEAIDFFEKLRQGDMKNFISNYVCSPIIMYDKVIGHIFVYSSVLDRHHISYEQAQYIDLMAQLLNYAMSKSAISQVYFHNAVTRVVNISLGGLLFELNDRVIFDHLTFHDRLKILLPIRHQMLELHAEVTRYFPTKNGFNIGVEFFKAAPEDFKILEKFIHDRSKVMFK